MADYQNVAVGWVNVLKSKQGKQYLRVKFGHKAAGLTLQEGMSFVAFKQADKEGMPPSFMLCVDNDVYEQARIDGGAPTAAKPVKSGEDFDFGGDDDIPF